MTDESRADLTNQLRDGIAAIVVDSAPESFSRAEAETAAHMCHAVMLFTVGLVRREPAMGEAIEASLAKVLLPSTIAFADGACPKMVEVWRNARP